MPSPSLVAQMIEEEEVVAPTAYMVETYSGRFVDTEHPDASSICIEDIAHALANTCRFGGHCRRFYPVAEHAVLVSKRLEQLGRSTDEQYAGLHHDDSETYLGDIPRPLKPLLGAKYTNLTTRMDKAICEALSKESSLHIQPHHLHDPNIKLADNWALLLEARFLLPSRGVNWTAAQKMEWGVEFGDSRKVRTPEYWKGGLSPEDAEQLYLDRHRELTER